MAICMEAATSSMRKEFREMVPKFLQESYMGACVNIDFWRFLGVGPGDLHFNKLLR